MLGMAIVLGIIAFFWNNTAGLLIGGIILIIAFFIEIIDKVGILSPWIIPPLLPFFFLFYLYIKEKLEDRSQAKG